MIPSPAPVIDHPARLRHHPAELDGGEEVRVVLRRARAAEDRHLVRLGVLPEHAVGVPQLLHRRGHELQLARVAPVGDELERRR
jgi:Fe2+ transport system protein FeoA